MFVSRSKKGNNAELKSNNNNEDNAKQITFILFDQTLDNVINMNQKVRLRMIYCNWKGLWHNLQHENDCYIFI